MANKSLFKSIAGRLLQKANVRNEAGGKAYLFSPEHALAQYAATGCTNSTYYARAEDQVEAVLTLAQHVDPAFLAKLALYAREQGAMKDMPALLCAVLAVRDGALLERIFPRVIDSAKMLRNFVQILRSGVAGRKSLGSRPKRLVRSWLAAKSDQEIFYATVGNDPSMADILKMIHPKPQTKSREALYAYILGRPHDAANLPDVVKDYEAFKSSLNNAA
jgi:60 kDa SS-A/Ro ribonucleoprotein